MLEMVYQQREEPHLMHTATSKFLKSSDNMEAYFDNFKAIVKAEHMPEKTCRQRLKGALPGEGMQAMAANSQGTSLENLQEQCQGTPSKIIFVPLHRNNH